MKKLGLGIVFGTGLFVGLLASQLVERDAMAQNNWQCMTWSFEPGGNANAVTNFLTGARTVELESAGLSSSRFAKQHASTSPIRAARTCVAPCGG
jgi:hypothetical protein